MLASRLNFTPAQRKFLWVMRASWMVKIGAIGGLLIALKIVGVI